MKETIAWRFPCRLSRLVDRFKRLARMNTLQMAVLLSVAVSLAVSGIAGVMVEYRRAEQLAYAEMQRDLESAGDILSAALDEPMWQFSRKAAEDILSAMARGEKIVSIVVTEAPAKEPFAEIRRTGDAGEIATVVKPVSHGKSIIGNVEISIALAPYRETAKARLRSSIVQLASILLIALGAISIVLRRKLLLPIERLTREAHRVAEEQLAAPIESPGEYELGRVAAAMEHMRTRLLEREAIVTAERDRSRLYLDTVQAIMVSLDRDGCISMINPYACHLLGYRADELLGKNWFEVCLPQPEGIETMFPYHQALIRGEAEDAAYLENDVIDSKGRRILVAWRNSLLKGPSGEVVGTLSSGEDITALKEAEHRLRESFGLLQELTSRRETAREEERKRIAREIHDELGQHLTALRMGISTVRLQFANDSPLFAERLQALVALTDKTIQVVRDITSALRPAVLDLGIGPAVEWLGQEFQTATGIVCSVAVGTENCCRNCYLSESNAMAVFRIVQESLTNVARHSGAGSVAIAIGRDGDTCRLEIRDDGRGFDPAVKSTQSFGLLGMRERALMLGGDFVIDASPGSGTRLLLHIPFANPKETS